MELAGVLGEVEEHRAEAAFGMDHLVAPVEDHEEPRVAGLEPEAHGLGGGGVVVFADRVAAPVGGLALQPGQQRAALEDVVGDLAAQGIDEGGGEVDGFDQRVAGGAPGGVGLGAGVVDDHRDLDRGFVEEVLFAQPVIAQVVAVVRGQHDHGVLQPAGLVEMVEQHAELVVALLDQPHVGGDHLVAHLVALEGAGDPVLHVGAEDGMRVVALGLVTQGLGHVVGAEHVVIGGGDDVGPVRLDVADMGAPALGGLVDEGDGLAGEPGGLAVLLADVGGLVGIAEHPARGDVAGVADPGIGEIRPGVGRGIALRLEVLVIGRAVLIVKAVGPLGPETVVAHPGIEAAFGLAHPDEAVGVDAEAGHARAVGAHVGLADEVAVGAERAQVVAEGHLADPEGKAVPLGPVRSSVAAGVEAHA